MLVFHVVFSNNCHVSIFIFIFFSFHYGELLTMIKLSKGATLYIIRGFEAVQLETDKPQLNQFHCPLYTLNMVD